MSLTKRPHYTSTILRIPYRDQFFGGSIVQALEEGQLSQTPQLRDAGGLKLRLKWGIRISAGIRMPRMIATSSMTTAFT